MSYDVLGTRIEHGWQRLADGLHVQRYFMHVHPLRRSAVHVQGVALGARRSSEAFPEAALLLKPSAMGAPIDTDSYVLRRSPWPVVLLGNDCGGSENLDEAMQLINAAELAWCAELAGNVMVNEPALADAIRSVPIEGADGWLQINLDAAPERIAAQWITAAAAQLWRWFARDRLAVPMRQQVSQPPGLVLDAVDVGCGLFAEALLERLRIGIERTGRSGGGPPWPAPVTFELMERTIDDLLCSLGDLVLQDLLQTNFPYPRRFEKYWAGGGAGQSE